jgi:hypothetical protein
LTSEATSTPFTFIPRMSPEISAPAKNAPLIRA